MVAQALGGPPKHEPRRTSDSTARPRTLRRFASMPFIITDPCIETKDTACVDVCPVDCIHPRKDEPEFAQATILYIHPEECIDCGACVPACPVAAIYESVDATPSSQKDLIEANAIYRNGDAALIAQAEEIVKAHIASHPELMAIPAAERQAAHATH